MMHPVCLRVVVSNRSAVVGQQLLSNLLEYGSQLISKFPILTCEQKIASDSVHQGRND